MSDTVIRVENLSKAYRLGVINHGMLYKDVQSWWARLRGKEDPNSVIGMYDKEQLDGDDRFWALRDVDFEVKRGDRVGIIGKNGAGKSTLLKILSRVTAPTKGNVRLKGRIASLLEVGTGFHPELTGRENVYLNGSILGMSKQEISRKFDEIVDFSGIGKFIDTPVKRYSSGMYVRLAFAVAAHLEPEILVVDEVLAVGDAEFQKKALGKMEDVSKGEGRTILLVSHNMAAIRQLCTYCLFLENGILNSIGSTDVIINKYIGQNKEYSLGKSEVKYEVNHKKDFQILNVKLLDKNGKQNNAYECDEEINVEIICESRRPIPGLYGWLAIDNSEGVRVLVSDTFDVLPNIVDNLSPNIYKISIKIPPRLIGHGHYSVLLSFGSLQASFDLDTPQNGCSFILSDSLTTRGNNRQGYISTLLQWIISTL